MSFKDIIVHAEVGKAGARRADFALAFAADHNAHLTAVTFAPTTIVPAYGEPGVIAPMPESYFEELEQDAQKALDDISDAAQTQGVPLETRLLRGVAGDFPYMLGVQARYSDLAIVGQPQGDAVWSNKGELISRLLMTSGRPVVVVPFAGFDYVSGQTALAAWDGSQEASRSFHDALPILGKSAQTLLYVGEPDDQPGGDSGEPGATIARHLSRHGIEVMVRKAESDELAIGDFILSRATSEDVGFVVMGGFHHSRLRELLVGGVTKTILEHMTVPVFMSH